MTLISALEQATLLYTKCYCEENIYHLLRCLGKVESVEKMYAVFISNSARTIPIWCQKSAVPGQPVIWDYHVISLAKLKSEWVIFDFDSRLPFPTPFKDYVAHAFRPNTPLPLEFQRKYRIVTASEYLSRFASDRSHMLKQGKWLSPPPDAPMIRSETETNNLESFVDMSPGIGEVVDEGIFFYYDGL